MATTVTKKVITGSTANTNNYTSGSFTPTVGDLLFVISHATGSIEPAVSASCTASANGITFTQVARLEHTLQGNVSFIYVADQLVPSSPAAMTVTVIHSTDPATGCFVAVGAVTGMSKTGAAAVLQSALSPNLAANAAWTVTFGSATNTNNSLVGFVGSFGGIQATPPGVTPPAGWTEIDEPVDQATPTSGFEWASVDSGSTSTAYTWTASVARPRANVGAIEFDGSSTGSRVGRLATKVLVQPTPDSRLARMAVKALVYPAPDSRIARLAVKALVRPAPVSQVARFAVKGLTQNVANFRGAAAGGVSAADTTVSPAWSGITGAAAGDTALIAVGWSDNTVTVGTPSGWSVVSYPAGAAGVQLAVFSKVLSSADITAGSVALTFSGSARISWTSAVYIGATTFGTPVTNQGVVTAPSVTPTDGSDVATIWCNVVAASPAAVLGYPRGSTDAVGQTTIASGVQTSTGFGRLRNLPGGFAYSAGVVAGALGNTPEGIAFEVIPPSALTRINGTYASTWNVASRVSGTLAETWNVASRVNGTLATTWNVGGRVNATLATSWNVAARVSGTLSGTWAVTARVSGTLAETWAVRQRVNGTLATSWNVATRPSGSLSTTWDVRQRVNASLASTWSVAARINGTLAESWNVAARITGSLAESWDVRQRIAAGLAESWNVLVRVAGTLAEAWAVRQRVNGALAEAWDVRQRIDASYDTTWNVEGLSRIDGTYAATWAVAQRVDGTLAETWDVEQRVAVTVAYTWDVRQRITSTLDQSWAVRQRISGELDTSWGLEQRVTTGLSLTWDVRQRIEGTLVETWDVKTYMMLIGGQIVPVRVRGYKTGGSVVPIRLRGVKLAGEIVQVT